MSAGSRRHTLAAALAERILLLDGATGTALAEADLDAGAYGGEALVGCHEALVLSSPAAVFDLHRRYLAAGADIVETDTFGATPVVLAEYGLAERTIELNRRAGELARTACAEAERTNPSLPRFVAGSIGPTTRSLTLTGGTTFAALEAAYRLQAEGLAAGGVDVLLVETCQDALNLKAALIACRDAAPGLPVAVSATIEPGGTTLGGQTIEAVLAMVEPWRPLWVGLNCATGPRAMADHLRALARLAPCAVSVVPNAGLPDADGRYPEGPDELATELERFAAAGWLNLLGGCCGTTPAHIRRLREVADRHRPRQAVAYDPGQLAGGEPVAVHQQPPPLIIGERTNVLGSRKFKRLVVEERWAEAAEVGRAQAHAGAQALDLCVADPEGDEVARMAAAVTALARATRVPLMIDSTDPAVLAAALTRVPGRPVLNSVNLEDGGERLDEVARLARRFGALVVAGCIDDHPSEGMARSAARKLEVAHRLVELLEGHGLRRQEILVDALVFPAATGDPQFRAAATETVAGVSAIKAGLPGVSTVLGISNVSFGLPAAGREVLNAVFLHHSVRAGLDAAIVNAQQLVRFPTLEPDEIAAAEAVLFDGSQAAVDAFVARYREARPSRAAGSDAPPAEHLHRMVVEGTRSGLEPLLDRLLTERPALDIVNGPLMAGMDEVGRLFGDGQLIVAEVLVSAEVMQAAVNHLRPHITGDEGATRGSILLATVRGDVHDIGKNLVGIIFSTNGYEVRDLGVQVPAERLVSAWREHPTDLIGLSGLLVRSAHRMVDTVEELRAAGIDAPVLVGGAALTGRFVRDRIAPAYGAPVRYAADAMAGLAAANALRRGERDGSVQPAARKPTPPPEPVAAPRPEPPVLAPASLPRPPDLERHVADPLPLDEVLALVNPQMLYGKHLGVRGSVQSLLERGDARVEELTARVAALRDEAVAEGWLRPRAVWAFTRAYGDGERVVLLDPEGRQIATLPYHRQARPPHLCAADWVHPDPAAGDTVALFVVTAGDVAGAAAKLRDAGRLLDSFALQALALETAEAAAEWVHRRVRTLWGLPDPPNLTIQEMFRARYRGIRLSFGYPACPALEPQATIFSILRPAAIGVVLTDGLMMAPEASVSAVVFHHPGARYFA